MFCAKLIISQPQVTIGAAIITIFFLPSQPDKKPPTGAQKTPTIQKHVRRKFLRHQKVQLALRWVVLVPFLLAQALLPTSTSMPTEHPTSTLEAVLKHFLGETHILSLLNWYIFLRDKSATSVTLFCDAIKQVLTDRLTLVGSGVV